MKRYQKIIIVSLFLLLNGTRDFLPNLTIYAASTKDGNELTDRPSDEVDHNIIIIYADGHREYRTITASSLTSTWDLVLEIIGMSMAVVSVLIFLSGGWLLAIFFGAIAVFSVIMFFYGLAGAASRISTLADQALKAGLPAVIDRAIVENFAKNNDNPIPHDEPTKVTIPTKLPEVFLQHGQQILGKIGMNKLIEDRYGTFNRGFNYQKTNNNEKPLIISTNTVPPTF